MRARRALAVGVTVLAALAVPVAVGAAGIVSARQVVYPARTAGASPGLADGGAVRVHDAARPTAVVVLGPAGANVADVLAPYEVFAQTGAFNLYTVAATHGPVTLTGGLDVVPDLTFGELDQRLPGGPDVIVVPQLVGAGTPRLDPVVAWLERRTSEGDPLLMSVCVGAEVLASAGMLDGRPATSHWLKLIGLRRDYPQVDWREGVRFVEDGKHLITTATVLSGVDGALRVVERMLGPAAAAHAARQVQWTAYRPGPVVPAPPRRPSPGDAVALLSAAYRWDRPSLGVLLTHGVGEIELASAFRPYTELSYLARTLAVSEDGDPIRSRHGLTFVPRADVDDAAPDLDRIVVPGAAAARNASTLHVPPAGSGRATPVYLHTGSGFAFDDTVTDIARTFDWASARWVAKSIQYPLPARTSTQPSGPAWPWALTLRPVVLAALTVAVLAGLRRLLPRRGHVTPDTTHPATSGTTPHPTSAPIRGALMNRLSSLRGPARRRFLRHYLEMVVAMLVGMAVLGPVESWLLDPIGWADLRTVAEVDALVMATNMTAAMVAWMRFRGHGWSPTAEMAAVMYLSFLVLLPLLWVGLLSDGGFMVLGHVLMFAAMAAVMLRRPDEYTGQHHRAEAHGSADPGSTPTAGRPANH